MDQKSSNFLADISFESGLQNIVLPSLMPFSCACYSFDLDDIQWNEAATLAACNFDNSKSLYLIFSNMKKLDKWQIFDSLKI